MRLLRVLLALVLGLTAAQAVAQSRGPVVLAAASLQESMTEAAGVWQRQGNAAPVLSFAASSALARQIEAGAPADIFFSADEPWMDYVQSKGMLRANSRSSFLKNHLVIIAPRHSRVRIMGFDVAGGLGAKGRLSLADPSAVPAGKYAKAALMHYGSWSTVRSRVASAENVRAALALVERGAAPLGVVYATDARASKRVRVVKTFPDASHPPILYPIAVTAKSRHPDAAAFVKFLQSTQGRAIFAKHGFDFH